MIKGRSIQTSLEKKSPRLEPVSDRGVKDKVFDVVPISELEEEERDFLKSYRPRVQKKIKERSLGRLIPFTIALFIGLIGGIVLGGLIISTKESAPLKSLMEMATFRPELDYVDLLIVRNPSEGKAIAQRKQFRVANGGKLTIDFGKEELRYTEIRMKKSIGKALNSILYSSPALYINGSGSIKAEEDIIKLLEPERSTLYTLTARVEEKGDPIGSFKLILRMDADQWISRAEALDGQRDKQDYCYLQAIQLKPNDVKIALKYADFLMEAKKWAKAAKEYKRVISLDPKNVPAKRNLASLYYAKSPKKALDIYTKLVEEDPSQKITYYKRIAKLQERLNIDQGNTYRTILRLNPKDKDAQRGLGTLYAKYIREARSLEKKGKLSAAIQKVKEARKMEVNKQNTQYLALLLNNLGFYFAQKGENKKAIKSYNESIEMQPDPLTFLNLADAYRKTKDSNRALKALKKAEELKPKDKKVKREILTLWASILIEKKDTKKAIERLNQLLKLNPTDPDVLEGIGKAYIDIEEYDKALKKLNLAVKYQKGKKGKKKALIYKIIGDLYRRKGSFSNNLDDKINQYRLALNAYEKAFTLKKDFKEALARWNEVAEERKALQIKKMVKP